MLRRTWTALVVVLLLALPMRVGRGSSDTLPASFTDREFWSLARQLSEPDGYFISRSGSTDNLLSNEMQISSIAAALAQHVPVSGVYLGVGPEQNFTYIVALRPRIAFITDVRRGNFDLHLVYKALFEMSANRGELVARLFSRNPVPALSRTSSAAEVMAAYAAAIPVDETTFVHNVQAIIDLLEKKHGFALTADDRANIEHACRAFYRFGTAINYTSTINGGTWRFATYAKVMGSVDGSGVERGFLASEENFAIVKDMERRNLIVPVVGDFAGPKALRAIAAWLRTRGATVGAFYVSNVEQYLQQKGVWQAFCANAATLPLDRSSIFIRPGYGGSSFSSMMAETTACVQR